MKTERFELTAAEILKTEDSFIEQAKKTNAVLSKEFISGEISYPEYLKKSEMAWAGYYGKIAKAQLSKVLSFLEPVELEALGEVVKDVKALASAFQFFTPMSVTKLEATLRDIPEGQLYRLKEKE